MIAAITAPAIGVLGAAFDLSRAPHYVHWHFFQMSVPNLIVIVLMVVVFVLAIVLRIPGRRGRA